MPGARCTHSPVCRKKHTGRSRRFTGITRHSRTRLVLTGLFRALPATNSSCHRHRRIEGRAGPGWADATSADLTPATGRRLSAAAQDGICAPGYLPWNMHRYGLHTDPEQFASLSDISLWRHSRALKSLLHCKEDVQQIGVYQNGDRHNAVGQRAFHQVQLDQHPGKSEPDDPCIKAHAYPTKRLGIQPANEIGAKRNSNDDARKEYQ